MAPRFDLRPPTDNDIPRIVALFQESSREIGIVSTTSEADVRAQWARPRFDRERHHCVVELDETIVGSATVWTEGPQMNGGGYVLPAYRGRGIGTALLSWVVESARAEPNVTELYTWTDRSLTDAVALMSAHPGAEHVRTFFRMLNRAPAKAQRPTWPRGIRLVPLTGDALVDALVEGHDASFIDHWNFTPMDRDEVVHELEHPDEDPALWLIAMDERNRVAGFCICHFQSRNGVRRGSIGPLGTTRPFRGIGLGRALLRQGLLALAERGATEVMLGVDTENPTGAVGLYIRNGFEVLREGMIFRIKL